MESVLGNKGDVFFYAIVLFALLVLPYLSLCLSSLGRAGIFMSLQSIFFHLYVLVKLVLYFVFFVHVINTQSYNYVFINIILSMLFIIFCLQKNIILSMLFIIVCLQIKS
jgi:hypothetical protein